MKAWGVVKRENEVWRWSILLDNRILELILVLTLIQVKTLIQIKIDSHSTD